MKAKAISTAIFINPLPYFVKALPAPIFRSQAPTIENVAVEHSNDPGLAGATLTTFDPLTRRLPAGTTLGDFVRFYFELEHRPLAAANGPTVVPYEIHYALRPVGGAEISAKTVRLNKVEPAAGSALAGEFYDLGRSVVDPDPANRDTHRFWMTLPLDLSSGPGGDPVDFSSGLSYIARIFDSVNCTAGLTPGEYEIVRSRLSRFDGQGPDGG